MGVVDHAGNVRGHAAFPIVDSTNLDGFLLPLFERIDHMTRERQVRGIGVLLPGYLKENRTVPRIMVNLPMLENVPLERLLRDRYGLAVALDIDRNGPARAECMLQHEERVSRLLYVTIGTGLGVGLVIDGTVCRITNDSVGELGHINLNPEGASCACGNVGCVETLISRDGVGRIAGQLGLCGEIMASSGARDFPRALHGAALSGNADALRVFEKFGRLFGVALTTYANLFSPDLIVIGGGLSGAAEFFLPVAGRWLNSHWMERATKKIRLRQTKFGMDAGIVGAASLVLHLSSPPGVSR